VAVAPSSTRIPTCVGVTIVALAFLGYAGARLGGGMRLVAMARVVGWGIAAMAVTAGIGALVGAAV
jgi:VIT1/CCC1 family predicted Fe2+/Mn2+ transporter